MGDVAMTATVREHGTNVKFVQDHCDCDQCREAHNRYERERRARTEPAYVSATRARAHVTDLMYQGVGAKTIAKAAGISHGALSKLMYGDYGRNMPPSRRIRRSTEAKLLTVTPSARAGGARIDAGPTVWRVDEMVAAGVPKSAIAVAIGQKGPGLQLSRGQVSVRHARQIEDIHARWLSGDLEFTRTLGRTKRVRVDPPVREKRPAADVSELYNELADIVTVRREQAEWRQNAACRGRPQYMWFPARGDQVTTDAATRICKACMVRNQCRAANLDTRTGIYGALTDGARKELRRQARDIDPTPVELDLGAAS